MSQLTRRDALRLGAIGGPAVLATTRGRGATTGWGWPPPSAPGSPPPPAVVPSPASPFAKAVPPEWFTRFGTNVEMRWDAVAGLGARTPNERFFVRNHTYTPLIDAAAWRLEVFGSGLRNDPVSFTYDQLRRLPHRTVTAAVECAGNGRSFFGTQQGTAAGGTQWRLGAIGAARWTGVPLSTVLERAGISRRAVSVLPEGLDATVVSNGVDDGHVRRPLPVEKALDDVLVAFEMNGEVLPYDHGFPARLIVPGWIGIANIKWLGRIEVADHIVTSPWDTKSYRLVGGDYPADSPPITNQVVKSAFELPWDATIPAGRRTELTGRSWSGTGAIKKVDVSVDGGSTWRRADLRPTSSPSSWTRWSVPWRPRQAGATELLARATDRTGATQPTVARFNTGGYLFDAVVRHPVTVTAT